MERKEQFALNGTDVITCFSGKARPGNDQINLKHENQTWLFVSEENKKAFSQNPEKYMPQFNGQCGFAVSLGRVADGNPSQYKVKNGKLYLAANPVARLLFSLLPNRDEKASAQWPAMAKN